jgi:DNA-binding beta-propeller fold protein YncE
VFPIKDAQTSEGTVTLRGTVTDNDGIQAVYVNGVAASLSVSQSSPAAAGLRKRAAAVAGDGGTSLEWEITLEVPFGDNTYEIVAEDTAGNLEVEPGTVMIRHSNFPTNAVLDSANNRLIGFETYSNGLALDLVTNTISEAAAISTGMLLAANAAGTKVYAITDFDHVVSLRSQDLSTGVESIEDSFTFTFDDTVWESAFLWDYVYLESGNIVYLLYQMVPISDGWPFPPWESRLYRWNIGSGITQIPLSVEAGDVPRLIRIELAGTKLAGLGSPFVADDAKNAVVTIDPATGVISPVADGIDAKVYAFAVDAAAEYAYLTGYEAVVRVALNGGEVTDISIDADQELFNFAQFNSVILDEARNRLLVSDIGLREMIVVDIQTGERSLLYPNGIGEGRKLIVPRELAISADNTTAYVLDDGDNAPESLLRIDLATGNRTRMGDVQQESNTVATGIALDEAGNRIFYAFDHFIYMMDLTSEIVTTIRSDSEGEGTGVVLNGISGLHYDATTARLLVLDASQNILVGINPETKHRELIALLTDGDTPPIELPVDVAVSADGSTYYVLGQKQGALYSVDAATGAREILLDECQGKLRSDGSIQNIDFNAVTGKFLITGDNSIVEYDLAEGACRIVSETMNVFDVLYLNNGAILGSNWNRLLQFDPVNGASITLSK